MRISQVRIRKYRCIKDLTIDVSDYTVLVGSNGSGKSSVLYALDWFFNDRQLSTDDVHATAAEPIDDGAQGQVDVEVTFSDLTDEDRLVLEKYGRGQTARLRKIWPTADGKARMSGNATQGPGFADVRAVTNRVAEMRPLYDALRIQFPDLADVRDKQEILDELGRWEGDPAKAHLLEEVEDSDATHMFGFDGPNTLSKRVRFVLIPAAADIVGQVGSMQKMSAVSKLVGSLMTEAITVARVKWEEDHAGEIASLSGAIRDGVEQSTRAQAARVNTMFATLVPNATVEFVPEVPSWSPKADASIFTEVVIDGERRDVSRQGHGIQRAVMISMLQAVVPDQAAAEAIVEQAGLEGDEADTRLQEELARLPGLVIGIEEPEIYQHPVRARLFARVLSQWAGRPNSQVILATHSPYFLLPEQLGSLRRFKLNGGCSEVSSTTADAVATAAGVDLAKVERVLAKEIPRTFSEGFFADAVVFVEGDTDRVALEVLSERLGKSLDANGTAILAMGGKTSLKIPFSLLNLIGIPVYIVTDADAQGAARKHSADPAKVATAAASHKQATDDLLAWLPPAGNALEGTLPFNWGDPTTITERWTIMNDDLEAELDAWPEFSAAIGTQGATLRSKNVAAVRSATIDADLAGLPAILRQLVEAVAAFG